jgi:hypothetical protein
MVSLRMKDFSFVLAFAFFSMDCQSPTLENFCEPSSKSRNQILVLSVLSSTNLSPCLSETGSRISNSSISSSKDITSYSIPSLNLAGVIADSKIQLTSDTLTSLTPFAARFSTTGKSVTVGGIEQISETTFNSYEQTLNYVVTAEDNTTKTYQVTLTAPRIYGGSSLRLWLKADSLSLNDGDLVAAWNDVSGFNNNLNQVTPTERPVFKKNQIGTLASVQFRQATTQRLSLSGATGLYVTNSASFFIVFKVLGTNVVGTTVLNLHGSNGREFALQHPTAEFLVCRNGIACAPSSSAQIAFNSYLALGSFQDANVTASEYWNGDFKGSIPAAGGNFNYSAGASPGSGYLSNGNLDADIAEVLFFNTLLNQNERDKIFCYLRSKYNLTASQTQCP